VNKLEMDPEKYIFEYQVGRELTVKGKRVIELEFAGNKSRK
jgi:hypothetical protein